MVVPSFSEPVQPSPAPLPQEEPPDQATLHQDGFRKVLLGQVADPIFAPTRKPSGITDDELTAQSLADPRRWMRHHRHPAPALWRWLLLVAVGAIALSLLMV